VTLGSHEPQSGDRRAGLGAAKWPPHTPATTISPKTFLVGPQNVRVALLPGLYIKAQDF